MDGLDTSRLTDLKDKIINKLEETELYRFKGTVSKLLGLTVEVKLPGLEIYATSKQKTADENRQKFKLLKVKLLNYFCSMMAKVSGKVVLLHPPVDLSQFQLEISF